MAGGQQGAGQGTKARANFLNGFRANRTDGFGDLGGQGGFSEKILP